MSEKSVLAVDLGAESGRVMRISFDGKTFALEEVHRFRNLPVETPDNLHWNVIRLWHEIVTGIEKARREHTIASIGLDAWGVDFALLDGRGNLIDNPIHYRDRRTNTMTDWVFQRVPARTIFERTGIQLMSINTLFQLASLKASNSLDLELADTFLTLPSLFLYWLSGAKVCEFTDATTTQMFNPRTNTWDAETLDALGIPHHFLPEVVMPGTRLGNYRGIPVIAVATHDTGSAVAAVPAKGRDFAYLSSGTWSLLGTEIPAPLINDAAFEANVTNEGGVEGTFRLLQNVMGLWLVQQSQKRWNETGSNLGYKEVVALAESAEPFRSLINVNDFRFLEPGDMPSRIRDFCRESRQPEPESIGQVARCIYESLAFKYRDVLEMLIRLTDLNIEHLHIVGGGSQNAFLNQLTANAINRPVYAGPMEATALGNALMQLVALGDIQSVQEGRRILSETIAPTVYLPQASPEYDEQYARLQRLHSPVK
jgi:rhamnulokinase